MILYLNEVEFENDIFSIDISDNRLLVLNKISESLLVGNEDIKIDRINVEVINEDGSTVNCPCTIGLSNDILSINTDYLNYEGKVLTPNNMVYCTIEVYDN